MQIKLLPLVGLTCDCHLDGVNPTHIVQGQELLCERVSRQGNKTRLFQHLELDIIDKVHLPELVCLLSSCSYSKALTTSHPPRFQAGPFFT